MTEKEVSERLIDLNSAIGYYSNILSNGQPFSRDLIKMLLKKTKQEIVRLETLMYNRELSDSYELLGLEH